MMDQNDLEVLHPQRTLAIHGEEITVRELTFGEQLKHNFLLTELAEGMRRVLPGATPEQLQEDGLTGLLDALAQYDGEVIDLVSICTGKPAEWIAALDGDSGEALLLTWWTVNQSFFTRRLLRPLMVRSALDSRAQAGEKSPPRSCATATTPSG